MKKLFSIFVFLFVVSFATVYAEEAKCPESVNVPKFSDVYFHFRVQGNFGYENAPVELFGGKPTWMSRRAGLLGIETDWSGGEIIKIPKGSFNYTYILVEARSIQNPRKLIWSFKWGKDKTGRDK